MAGESGTPGAGASGRGPGRYQPAVKANDYVVPKSQYFFEHDDRGAGRREPGKRRGAPFESRREEFHPPRRNWVPATHPSLLLSQHPLRAVGAASAASS
mmetsp:Transcript_46980/g.118916  ORF Transcript_46980/g.118916 Transcript_46980/m.118916 type:complete len:99 (+) Transcript_46980:208-504(+)